MLQEYLNQASLHTQIIQKQIFLKSQKIISKYGEVSKQNCFAVVKNLSKISKTNIVVSITGIAGPADGTKKKPVGLVYIDIKKDGKIEIKKNLFKNKGRL